MILAAAVLLALSGCSRGLVGSYRCTGIPDIQTLTLESDGSYTARGDILGHVTSGSGKYVSTGQQVILEGSYQVEGLTLTEPSKVILDREKNGDLKSLLTTCKKS